LDDSECRVEGRLTLGNKTVKVLVYNLQDLSRSGKAILDHITPLSTQLQNNITERGSINWMTGLPEFFFDELFNGFGHSLSKFSSYFSIVCLVSVTDLVATSAISPAAPQRVSKTLAKKSVMYLIMTLTPIA
jgi:hypothetical protein